MTHNDKSLSPRTDLAIEAREMVQEQEKSQGRLDGIEVKEEKDADYMLTHVRITTKEGSRIMGKPMGNYITIEAGKLKENHVECHENLIGILAKELGCLARMERHDTVLVAGLGNWNITPDALGPKVVSKILVTRHLKDALPHRIMESVRPVAAVSPGVMGITGMETREIVKGIVEKLHPKLLIAVDALAARKTSRINTTIQLSDTGLAPGAGVGNERKMLNEETLGIPVIAIGVPTVVDAATLVNDTMDCMLAEMKAQTDRNTPFYDMLRSMEHEEKYGFITELLHPYMDNMFVTPKEVDAVVDRLAGIIANAVNIALHPGITLSDINRYQS